MSDLPPIPEPLPRKVRMKPGRKKGWRKNPVVKADDTTVDDRMLHELVKGHPVSPPGEVEQALAAVEKKWKETHQDLQPNDVVQIISGDNTGVLIQVGRLEAGTIKGYQIRPDGERALISCKIEEAARIGKGKKAWKFPAEDETPDWHRDSLMPPPQ